MTANNEGIYIPRSRFVFHAHNVDLGRSGHASVAVIETAEKVTKREPLDVQITMSNGTMISFWLTPEESRALGNALVGAAAAIELEREKGGAR